MDVPLLLSCFSKDLGIVDAFMNFKTYLLVVLIACVPLKSFAGWDEPQKVVDGSLGEANAQFGIYYGDTSDFFPKFFIADKKNRLFVSDRVNKRLQIFDGGRHSIITAKELPERYLRRSWPYDGNLVIAGDSIFELRHGQIYDINGNLTGSFATLDQYYQGQDRGGNLYFKKVSNNVYNKYSPTGELLTTYDEKPLGLGVKTSRRRADSDNRYDTTVRYEDITYHVILDGDWDDFVRDQNDYLYFYNSYTAHDPVSNEPTSAWLVVKFDRCGKQLAKLMLPVSEYERLTQEQLRLPVSIRPKVRNEYGPPVIGPDGSVYCWKRTPDTYSILKWQWVDDPGDPQPGPDAPENLKVIPSLDGLYLTWGASPQDPGCVDRYEIVRAASAGGIYTPVATVDKGTLKYNDTTVPPGSTYFYKVRAVANGLSSDHTAPVSAGK